MDTPDVQVTVESDHGCARLTLTAVQKPENAMIAATLSRRTAELVVRNICKAAGLPEPWGRR